MLRRNLLPPSSAEKIKLRVGRDGKDRDNRALRPWLWVNHPADADAAIPEHHNLDRDISHANDAIKNTYFDHPQVLFPLSLPVSLPINICTGLLLASSFRLSLAIWVQERNLSGILYKFLKYFITVFTKAHHLSLSRTTRIQFTMSYPTFFTNHFNIILPSTLIYHKLSHSLIQLLWLKILQQHNIKKTNWKLPNSHFFSISSSSRRRETTSFGFRVSGLKFPPLMTMRWIWNETKHRQRVVNDSRPRTDDDSLWPTRAYRDM